MTPKTLSPAAEAAMRRVGLNPSAKRLLSELRITKSGRLRTLLSSSQHKMDLGEERGWATKAMHLAPASDSGFNVCPKSSAACRSLCIKHTGHMVTTAADRARVARTLLWMLYPGEFIEQLHAEVASHRMTSKVLGFQPGVRPNATSDVLWERFGLPQEHPEVQFHDYTKVPLDKRRGLPSNYHLTFSVSERAGSLDEAMRYLRAGHNAAIVISSPEGKSRGDAKREVARILDHGALLGFPAIDGDTNDLRHTDPPGHWVLLAAKGTAAQTDRSGFVFRDAFTPRRHFAVVS